MIACTINVGGDSFFFLTKKTVGEIPTVKKVFIEIRIGDLQNQSHCHQQQKKRTTRSLLIQPKGEEITGEKITENLYMKKLIVY